MAEKNTDADKILKFARYLRDTKCDIDKEYTVEINPLMSEMPFKQQSTQEIDECIDAMDDVLKSLKEISNTVGQIKETFQGAKILGLEEQKKQIRKSQVRETSGRTLGLNQDSGCFSADSRVLSECGPVTQPSDVSSTFDDVTLTSPSVISFQTEPTQHEDTSKFSTTDDSSC